MRIHTIFDKDTQRRLDHIDILIDTCICERQALVLFEARIRLIVENPPTIKKAGNHLLYVHCPNCNRKCGAISLDTKGIQQYVCKDSKCRCTFYTVDGKVQEKLIEKVECF